MTCRDCLSLPKQQSRDSSIELGETAGDPLVGSRTLGGASPSPDLLPFVTLPSDSSGCGNLLPLPGIASALSCLATTRRGASLRVPINRDVAIPFAGSRMRFFVRPAPSSPGTPPSVVRPFRVVQFEARMIMVSKIRLGSKDNKSRWRQYGKIYQKQGDRMKNRGDG